MDIWNYDQHTGLLLSKGVADESPLEEGEFLIPANATSIEPPAAVEGKTIHFIEGEWVYLNVPAPIPPSPPRVVSMRQARLALLGAGLLASVNSAIDAIEGDQGEAARIEWEYATEVRRDSGLVTAMTGALNLDDEMLDALFTEAAAL